MAGGRDRGPRSGLARSRFSHWSRFPEDAQARTLDARRTASVLLDLDRLEETGLLGPNMLLAPRDSSLKGQKSSSAG